MSIIRNVTVVKYLPICGNNIMLNQTQENTDEEIVLKSITLISKRKNYQFWLILFLGMVYHIMCIAMLAPAIIFLNPTFDCQGDRHYVSQDKACQILPFCSLNNNDTLTAKLHLYCGQRKDDRNLAQSISGIGNAIGVIMVNWLADRKGKRFCIILSIFLAAISSYFLLIGAVHENIELLIISQFLAGCSYGAYATLIFFLGSRYLSDLSNYVVLMFYLCGTGTAQISIAFLNEYFSGWQAFAVIFSVSLTLAMLVAPFLVKEDPVYLYNNGQMDNLMHLIEDIGRSNKATVQQMQLAENQLSRINKIRVKRTPQLQEFIPDQIKSFKVLLLIFVMACCSFTTNAVYFGIGFEIDTFGLSITTNMLIFGAVQIFNYIFTMSVMSYMPSIRVTLYASALIPTLFCLSFITDAVTESQILQLGAIAVVRFMITTYGCFYITYYVANLPKKIEGTAAGIIQGLGSAGKVVAPYSANFASKNNINPMGIFGIIYFIIGFLPLLFIPSTTSQNSPQDQITNQIQDSVVK